MCVWTGRIYLCARNIISKRFCVRSGIEQVPRLGSGSPTKHAFEFNSRYPDCDGTRDNLLRWLKNWATESKELEELWLESGLKLSSRRPIGTVSVRRILPRSYWRLLEKYSLHRDLEAGLQPRIIRETNSQQRPILVLAGERALMNTLHAPGTVNERSSSRRH